MSYRSWKGYELELIAAAFWVGVILIAMAYERRRNKKLNK